MATSLLESISRVREILDHDAIVADDYHGKVKKSLPNFFRALTNKPDGYTVTNSQITTVSQADILPSK
jgi:hypothetical protein